jgi:hypothetical protein
MQKLLGIAALIALAAFAARNQGQQRPAQNSIPLENICERIIPHIKNVIPPAVSLGIISKDDNMTLIYVREHLWRDAGPDMRQAIAMAAFCSAHMGGIGGSQVRSHETGKILLRVRDGSILE